ncbi:hypothetical protein GCM10022291_11820 [Postechiella marina]|uniref:3-oxoacyl-ACP synthase n=1 Tax=Postechiella marina TaxID=943941 RepID=A0ABP8C4Z4_9FLAO
MKSQLKIKAQLFNACAAFIENRYTTIQHTINEIQTSLTSETKSSAGDKHETGRAMLQLEREKAGNQLAEVEKTRALLSKVDVEQTSSKVGLGSVVYTSKLNYYIAISAGELSVENTKFYAISANTPIGQLLIGKTIDSEIVFRDQKFKITAVL